MGTISTGAPSPNLPPSSPFVGSGPLAQQVSLRRPHYSPFGSTIAQSFVRRRSTALSSPPLVGVPSNAESVQMDPQTPDQRGFQGVQSAPLTIEEASNNDGQAAWEEGGGVKGGDEQNPPETSSSLDSPVACDPPCDSPEGSVTQNQGEVSDEELTLLMRRIMNGTRRDSLRKRVADALELLEDGQPMHVEPEFYEKSIEGSRESLEKCSAQQMWCKEGELT